MPKKVNKIVIPSDHMHVIVLRTREGTRELGRDKGSDKGRDKGREKGRDKG